MGKPTVVSLARALMVAPEDATTRCAVLPEEVRRKAEPTNADAFVSSFSGNWGDYLSDDIKDNLTDDADESGRP